MKWTKLALIASVQYSYFTGWWRLEIEKQQQKRHYKVSLQ